MIFASPAVPATINVPTDSGTSKSGTVIVADATSGLVATTVNTRTTTPSKPK